MTDPLTVFLASDGAIPNSALPLLVYRDALPSDPAAIEAVFAANRWRPAWRDRVHPFHHFHANTHEALGVASGSATVRFGGSAGVVLTAEAGDLIVVPAGVGHCNLAQSDDLLIVGAYPDNAPTPDLHRGKPSDHDRLLAVIGQVPMPAADPVAGEDGPMGRVWRQGNAGK